MCTDLLDVRAASFWRESSSLSALRVARRRFASTVSTPLYTHSHLTHTHTRITFTVHLADQEACRLNAADGKKSLIRSFPSKVGVSHSALPLELMA